MKLTLFGATGPTGLLVTQKALDAGHDLTVYVRDPSKLAVRQGSPTVVNGELDDAEAITSAVIGKDAVISLLGPKRNAKGRALTLGTQLIVAAMKANGVRRLIATTTASYPDPDDHFSFAFWTAIRLVRLLERNSYDEILGAAQAVHASDLDWTLVRLPMLTSKYGLLPPAVGYIGSHGIRLFSLSRNVLADFLLSQLTDEAWLHRAPAISN